MIIFVAGNNQAIPSESRELVYYPIRFCLVKEVRLDRDTKQIVAVLELHQFVTCEWESTDGPPQIFLTRGNLIGSEASNWLDCVQRIEAHFSDVLFYRINRVLSGNKIIKPTYLEDARISRFDLDEETDYSLECLYYDRKEGTTPLSVKCDSDIIEISNSFEFGAGAMLDKRYIHLKTALLTVRSARAFITFSSGTSPSSDPNHLQVLWQVQRGNWKEYGFAFFVILAGVGLALVQTGAKNQYAQWFSGVDAAIRLVGALLVGAGGGLLYRFFNKTS